MDSSFGCGALGQDDWPGLAKLIEESGETLQIVGKIVAFGGTIDHPSGYNTKDKLEEELADLLAAIRFTVKANPLDEDKIMDRSLKKEALFWEWHRKKTWQSWEPGDVVPVFKP